MTRLYGCARGKGSTDVSPLRLRYGGAPATSSVSAHTYWRRYSCQQNRQ